MTRPWMAALRRLRAEDQAPWRARLRWHVQHYVELLGRGGVLALAASLIVLAHCVLALWPEKDELLRRHVELIAELHACSPSLGSPGADMDTLRAQMRLDPDQRKLAVMEQLQLSGLLLVDIQYLGEEAVQGRLRRTSVDISAVGSYQDLTAALRELTEEPLLRLEALALDRQQPENMLVNIKMRLSMLGVV